jgi:transcriptional regulator with XRE-family HTH domain
VPVSKDVGTGARIKAYRKLRHLTQLALAERAHVSYSILTKVESGDRPASPALIAACARALGVEANVLTGQPYHSSRDDALRDLLSPVRVVLDLYDLPPDESVQPRPVAELRDAVRTINRQAQAAKYQPMLSALPGLLVELHTAAHIFSGADQLAAWGLLAEAYRCGHSAGIAIGMTDLSATALARMDWAAQRSGDRAPGLRAAREYLRVTAYLREGDYDTCRRLNASGVRYLDGTTPADPGAVVARGQLHLGASVIAARVGDRDAVDGHLEEAAHFAKQAGEDTETFWFGFGPTNVRVHRVMTLVELSDYDAAVRAAKGLRFPGTWLPTRIGHHHIDLARAHQWMNHPDQALTELHKARKIAPQQAKRHPSVRETVGALVRADRRGSEPLAEYASWIEQ